MLIDYFHVQLRQSIGVLLPLDSTIEVITLNPREICLIPGVPPAVLGVVNQRGKLLWVIELSDLLGLAPLPKQVRLQHNLILVVLASRVADATIRQSGQIACVVSALSGVVTLDPQKFQPGAANSPIHSSFLSGVAEIKSPVGVLNVNAVLASLSSTPNLVSL